jgi:hypothetical protein
MKKILPIMIVIVVLMVAGSFYGGMKYQSSKSPSRGQFAAGLPNFTGADRQQMGAGARAGSTGKNNVGFINGEILGKDDQSVTVKLRDGGSKTVFYSASTSIGKMATGTSADLTIGTSVMVTGKSGTDGNLTAETIQIRSGAEPMGPGAPNQLQQ